MSEMTELKPSPQGDTRRGIDIMLWVMQGLLALVFLYTGVMKLVAPIDTMAQTMAWVGDVPSGLVRFIGLAEVAGAIGIFLPAATRIAPGLTPLSGLGLLSLMVLASLFHIARGEYAMLITTVSLGAVATLVGWGRYRTIPILPRSQDKEHHEPPGLATPQH